MLDEIEELYRKIIVENHVQPNFIRLNSNSFRLLNAEVLPPYERTLEGKQSNMVLTKLMDMGIIIDDADPSLKGVIELGYKRRLVIK